MPTPFSVDEFAHKIDSLYRLVIVAARRANQIKTEAHGFVGASRARKPTIQSLEEVLEGKVSYTTSADDEENLLDAAE
ncbi:MAG TPA: DNA-directed RNA polymerase subunit omega [Candidatus Hydrogenedentes bacterium]|nr:DNA-directed RNA polymerase subunit omega [Candidatus Hydrogenedentota bacterium]HNT87066.1 DNA-directed RNA polymerase subunit omega [Candidatus Hydrogenedentota bacterium]